jgi:hypothetical protein
MGAGEPSLGRFVTFHRPSWNLDAHFGEIDMAEDEQLVAASKIGVYFVYGFHRIKIIKDRM